MSGDDDDHHHHQQQQLSVPRGVSGDDPGPPARGVVPAGPGDAAGLLLLHLGHHMRLHDPQGDSDIAPEGEAVVALLPLIILLLHLGHHMRLHDPQGDSEIAPEGEAAVVVILLLHL